MEKDHIIPLYSDFMSKYIFGYQKNVKFTTHLLELIFDVPSGTYNNAIIKNSLKLDKDYIMSKDFETDIIIELPNKELVNLEFYSYYNKVSEIKSFLYITRLFSNTLEKGNDYQSLKKIIQINIVKNNSVHITNNILNKYLIINTEIPQDKMLNNLYEAYIINLDEEKNILYNNNELERWLKLIGAETKEEIKSIIKGDKLMEEVYKEMNNFNDEYYWTKYFTRERMERSQRHYAKEEGFKESQIETVKNMLTKIMI